MTVYVSYEGYDENRDRELEALAEQHNLKSEGSGYGLGQRDHEFKGNRENEQRFSKAVTDSDLADCQVEEEPRSFWKWWGG